MQILAWASSYYLPAVIAGPVAESMGWPLSWSVGGVSLGLLVSGLAAPRVGGTIDRSGGRPVLAASSVLLAGGLALLALSQGLVTYLAAWVVMGLGMGAGLYDAAFAALGRCYGERARRAITALTLFGGFASTVGWPLSAWLTESLGWRGACAVYAALQLALALPVYLTVLPREERRPQGSSKAEAAAGGSPAPPGLVRRRTVLALLASAFTLGDVIWSVLSVHVIIILRARGVPLPEAVALGALVGPSQVAARAVEMLTGRHYHPIWTLTSSSLLFAAGVALLWAGPPLLAVGFMLYGAGGGMRSIARGTLPLALFGASGYPTLIGRLATPSLLAQSVSPILGALLLDGIGATALTGVLAGIALVQLVSVALLWVLSRPLREPQQRPSPR
jgi:predicted MFS family arabinose efflux permease